MTLKTVNLGGEIELYAFLPQSKSGVSRAKRCSLSGLVYVENAISFLTPAKRAKRAKGVNSTSPYNKETIRCRRCARVSLSRRVTQVLGAVRTKFQKRKRGRIYVPLHETVQQSYEWDEACQKTALDGLDHAMIFLGRVFRAWS